jgi:hypothetical protein
MINSASVSKDGHNAWTRGHPSRRAQGRAPQDEGGDIFTTSQDEVGDIFTTSFAGDDDWGYDAFVRNGRPRFNFQTAKTFRHNSAFPRRNASEWCTEPSAPERAWGMPGARCTRSLACEIRKHTSIVTTGSPETPGIPARNGFNGLFRALPGDEFVLSPSSAD